MTSKLDRRALLRLGGAAAATGMAASRVVAQDTPAGPTTPMPPVETFATPVVKHIALSPDGSRCALVTEKSDENYLVHFPVANPAPKLLAMGKDRVENLMFGDNSRVVVTNRMVQFIPGFRGDVNDIYVGRIVDLDKADVKVLYKRNTGFFPMMVGRIHRMKLKDGYKVAAANVKLSVEAPICLHSFSLDNAIGFQMHEGSPWTRQWLTTPDGFLLAYANVSDEGKTWSLFYNYGDADKSRFRMIYSLQSALTYPTIAGIGRDGKSVAVIVPRGEDVQRGLYEISPEGTLSEALHASDDTRDYAPLFHPASGRLAGYQHHGDWLSNDYFDPLLKKLSEGVQGALGDDYRAHISDFAEDPRKMIFYAESPTDAGSYYFADFSSGEVQFLAANYPNVPEEWLTQKTTFRYKAADELEITAYLTLPPFREAHGLPLVVLPHGGPEARDHIGFDWRAQVLASRGYAVLQPNFRGSTGYGRDFVEKGYGEWGARMQTDLSDGIRYLADQGVVDRSRVAIMGASYGGYAALAGATLQPNVYRCAISIAGMSDLKTFIDFEINDVLSKKARSVLYWQRWVGDQATWAARSPARHANAAGCPVLLMHGTLDTIVHIDESRRMEKALKAAGKAVEFVTYEGQDHWETVGSHRVTMMETALAFLQKHNPA